MTTGLALAGWMLALPGLGAALALARAAARRAELVARACHEVRGPLAAARLGLHGLAAEAVAGGPAGGSGGGRRVAAIDLELRRAGLALDDLRAAPRGRRAPDRLDLLDARALLAEAAAAWAPVAQAHGGELRCSWAGGDAWVRGDRVRLAQAIGNLLANAIEHGGAGPVLLRGRPVAGRVRVEITDRGPGLPAPVVELARRPRAGRGTRGRGLAIAAEIAERHGGRLAAAPSAQGARLVLELRAAR